jgi:DNA mismatch endonuclease (patch repair protein)
MSRVRNRNTAPESALRRELYRNGIRGYQIHRRDIPGSPDLAWIGRKVAIFVDGAFWHGHPSAFVEGQSGAFWDEKISRNRSRDRQVDSMLMEMGWTVVRMWDFEILQSPDSCVARVRRALDEGSKS